MEWNITHPLSHDPVRKIVRAGDVEFTEPDLSRRKESDWRIKEQVCGRPEKHTVHQKFNVFGDLDAIAGVGISIADTNKWYCARLGPRFNYRFQAAMYHTWISPHFSPVVADMLRFGGRNWRAYDNALVREAHACLEHIHQAERDGLVHLVPIILMFGKSPQDIRAEVGRGLWRRLANNSRTRNWLIMRTEKNRAGSDLRGVEFLSHIIDLPSGVIPCISSGSEYEWIAARLSPRKRRQEYTQTAHLVYDTQRMLGRDFNPHWSLKRMKEEHDRAISEQNRKRYSDKPFAEPWQMESDGYTATLLTSPLEIANEGMTQHHCVASYAGEAKRGHYAVFCIDGKERATLGLRRRGVNEFGDVQWWNIEQCYAACNQTVKPETMAFAHKVSQAYKAHKAPERRG